MRRAITCCTAVALTLLASSLANASNVPRHERVDIKEVKKGGEVVGLKLKLVLRTEMSGFTVARVSLAPSDKKAANHREAASNKSDPHMLHRFEDITVPVNKPTPMEWTILFKDNPNLKPGMKVEIVSAWNSSSSVTAANSWHVYGMTGAPGVAKVETYAVPGKAAAAAKNKGKGTGTATAVRRASPKNPRTASTRTRSTSSARSSKPKKPKPRARAR